MTLDELIAEGRALQRPCWFLSTDGAGEPVGIWHSHPEGEARRWLTVAIAGYAGIGSRYISVLSGSCGGQIELLDQLPRLSSGDVELVAGEASVLPPIDAIFAFGSNVIGSWLAKNGWERDCGYNPNFPDAELIQQYERIYHSEHPFYGSSNAVAIVGGWHVPFPDGDWRDLVADDLLLMTLKDAEPWVEAWKTKDGKFKVIERIT